MTSSPLPKLPAWIFYATDVALLAAACFVAAQAPRPLSNGAIFAIVACVIAGAVIALVPRLVEYEREKNSSLDERQRALEALAQTVASSAEQISVAAQGLHAIADLSHKNLRHAEQLPHKLQDKIAEFQAQLANAADAEKEEMEKELVALRSSESERLESISARIAKSTAELARLEASLQKQLLPLAARAAATTPTVADKALPPEPSRETNPTPVTGPEPVQLAAPGDDAVAAAKAEANEIAHPPKRVRKTRREEIAPLAPVAGGVSTSPSFPVAEPPPVKLQEIAPVVPGSHAPYSDRLAETLPATATPASPAANLDPAVATIVTPEKPARKRSEKKSAEATIGNLFGIEVTTSTTTLSAPPLPSATPASSEFAQVSPDEAAPAVAIAADGATRLLVTAYIGIGNRLFIRGEGPGLSWEKGIPLQFVSIGKWRWETADATSAIKFKLYKNDQIECATLGLQSLTAGHQQELTASF